MSTLTALLSLVPVCDSVVPLHTCSWCKLMGTMRTGCLASSSLPEGASGCPLQEFACCPFTPDNLQG